MAGDWNSTGEEAGSHTWKIILGLGGLTALLYILIPYGALAGILYVLITWACALLISLPVFLKRGQTFPRSYLLIGLAVFLAGVGHAIWYALELMGREPFPSPADIFYLVVYPLFIIAFWKMGGANEGRSGALIDALIVGVAASVLAWIFLILPHIHNPELGILQLLISAIYPVGDIILFTLVLRMFFLQRSRIASHALLLIGISLYLLADVLYAHGNSAEWYDPGGWTDFFWLASYLLMATASWHPSSAHESSPPPSGADLSWKRMWVLGIASISVPAVTFLSADLGGITIRTTAFASILIFVLILYRMAGLIREIHRRAESLDTLSRTDSLTGAYNRRHFEEALDQEIETSSHSHAPLSLALLDLDHFKQYNDRHGHPAGDTLLQDLVTSWQPLLRHHDLLARVGGEEFVILFPQTPLAEAYKIIESLRNAVPQQQTCSAGIVAWTPDEIPASLLQRADQALYRAKHQGRNQTVVARATVPP